jgi:hypothetical protein
MFPALPDWVKLFRANGAGALLPGVARDTHRKFQMRVALSFPAHGGTTKSPAPGGPVAGLFVSYDHCWLIRARVRAALCDRAIIRESAERLLPVVALVELDGGQNWGVLLLHGL